MVSRPRSAIVTGIGGQDGRYAADILVEKGYRVIGTGRGATAPADLPAEVEYARWDLRDPDAIAGLIAREQPGEFYNFAAYATGSGMFDDPVGMGEVNGLAVVRILEAIRGASPHTRLCHASSAEMFGAASGSPQSEASRFDPRSPYGAAKVYAHSMIGIYRQRFGVFGCSAILFNHESPRRGEAFVTRKITRGAAAIKLGLADHLQLGSLSARRDWGYAGDYVRAMWLMLQAEAGDDYVVATGITHSVEDLCRIAFARVGLDYRQYVRVGEDASRAPDPLQLVGDPRKAARELGWTADVPFERLVADMVDADLARLGREKG